MSYQPHNLLAFGGTLEVVGADDEIWECTIRAMTGTIASPAGRIEGADCDEFLSDWEAPLKAWFTAANTKIPNTVKLTYAKCNPIDADGKYSDGDAHTRVFSSAAVGAAGSGTLSFASVVYSWRASPGPSRGFATKGRMYPPNFGIPCSPTMGAGVGSGDRSTACTQAVALISSISGITLGDGAKLVPMLVSKQGSAHPIRSVLVGNVYDVQRRRKNAIKETYTANVFAP